MSLGGALPAFLTSTAHASGGYAYPSTNSANKTAGHGYVEETSAAADSVTLTFHNPDPYVMCFEYRSDGNTAQKLTDNGGHNYNASVTDGLYPHYCLTGSTESHTITANSYVEVRSTFGAERDTDFNWTKFYDSPACTYDFPVQKMWEVTWGYGFNDRNGGAPKFDMQSNGGLVSLNGGPVPSYMTAGWHWLYVTAGQNAHYTYGFADGTVRTADVVSSEVNGCQVPTITWKVTGVLNAENFNTVNEASYKGISVGFNAKDFETVTGVTVDMTRTDGTHAIKHGTQDLFDLIDTNTAPYQFTTPFVIQPGNYDPATDSYWTSDPTTWDTSTVPESVTITVTGSNGAISVTNSTFNQGSPSWPTYASLLPDPTNSHTLNVLGSVYRDNKLNDCTSLTTCKSHVENLPDWQMHLYKEDLSGTWQLVSTATTDATGVFRFGSQPTAGTYHVCEVLPAVGGWTQTEQTWSGSGYLVNTANLSPNAATEGPYCNTLNYDDSHDLSWASRFGNVDTGKPTGTATYTGGNKVGDVIYLRSIDDLKYSATLSDNYALDQTSFVVFKLDANGHRTGQFCGNWHNSSSTETISGTTASVTSIPVNKCSWYQGNGAWTDGSYEISHIVYDKAGNTTRFNATTQKFTIDNTQPNLTVTAPSASDDWQYVTSTDSPIAVNGTVSDGLSGIKSFGISVGTYNPANTSNQWGTWVEGCSGLTRTGDDFACSVNLASLNSGKYVIRATVQDNAGNWNAVNRYFIVDNTAPTVPQNVHFIQNGSNLGINAATNHTGSNLWFVWDASSASSGIKSYQVTGTTPAGDPLSFTINDPSQLHRDLTGLFNIYGEGTYTFQVRATSNVGLQSAFSATGTIVYDHTRPTIVFTSPADFSQPFKIGPMLTIEVTDPNGSGVDASKAVLHVYNADNNSPTSAWCNNTTSCDTSSLPDGDYYVKAGATDAAGNNQTITKYFTIDHTNPSVAASMSSTSINAHTTTEPTVTINASDSGSGIAYVQYKVMDSSNATVLGWVTISNGTPTPISGILSLSDGTYTLRARAFDNAGNKKSGADVAFTVDKTAPAVSIVSDGQNGNVLQPTISVDGKTAPTSGYTYSWDSHAGVDVSNYNALNPTFTVNTDGTYDFVLTVTDLAGNSNTATLHFSYTTPVQGGGQNQGFTQVAGTQQPTGGTGTPAIAPLADNGTGTTTPEVKGDSTSKSGVKGDNVVKFENSGSKKGGNGFLGLGWWWIPVIVVVAFLWWLLAARRRNDEEE